MNLQDLGIGALVTGVLGGGGVWAWLSSRGANANSLVAISQDAAGSVIGQLRDEIKRLADKVAALESKVDAMRLESHTLAEQREQSDALAHTAKLALDRELAAHAATRAEGARLQARVEQLEGELRLSVPQVAGSA